jgi:hypothetical protein
MSLRGAVRLVYGDGEHEFRIGIGQTVELQERVNAWRNAKGGDQMGLRSMILAGLRGDLWPHEVREVIRLALIGAGTLPSQAHVFLERNFEAEGLTKSTAVAVEILAAAFPETTADEDKKKQNDGSVSANPTGSIPPESTPPASSWDSGRASSINGRGPIST